MRKLISCLVAVLLVFCCLTFVGCEDNYIDKTSKNLTNYNINTSYDEVNHKVSAVQTVDFINDTNNALMEVKFHIYANAYRNGATIKPLSAEAAKKAYPNGTSYGDISVDSAKVNSKAVALRIEGVDNDILTIPLESELFPNERVSILLDYVVTLANVKHRLGYGENTINLGNFYPVVCHYDEQGWVLDPYYPNGDPFVTQIANYKVSIIAKNEFVVASSGDFVQKEEVSGAVKHSYSAKSIRDFAMVLSNKFEKLSAEADGVLVNYYFFADKTPNDSLIAATDSIKSFNKMIGKYPYATYNVVEADFCHGGMEYPNLVMITSGQSKLSYEIAVIHETAHQWWYGVVGNNQVKDAWMDEGLTEYTTMLFFKSHPEYKLDFATEMAKSYNSYALYMDVLANYIKAVDVSYRDCSKYRSENEYVLVTYLKGMLMFDTIRELVGQERFVKCLQQYYKDGRMKINSPQEMIASFNKGGGVELSTLFNTWISGKEVITIK